MKKPEQKISKSTKRIWRRLTKKQQLQILDQAVKMIQTQVKD